MGNAYRFSENKVKIDNNPAVDIYRCAITSNQQLLFMIEKFTADE